MEEVVLRVQPAPVGWGVACSLSFEQIYFRSGGRAELTARSMAVRLAKSGHSVSLLVSDRTDQVIATQHYVSQDGPETRQPAAIS